MRPSVLITVRPARKADSAAWLRLRGALWTHGANAVHRREIAGFFAVGKSASAAAFVAEARGGKIVGFAEASIRPYAEGCRGDRVAYLEGWFVAPEARERGVGRALVKAVEQWGRAQKCAEFASDAEYDNAVSASAHRALGFADAGLLRCFRKHL
jgi:aminoglycoside 6'-N-acetyltransferase I